MFASDLKQTSAWVKIHCTANTNFWGLASDVATTILATLPLFATGLGGLGALGWHRKRKATLREINGIAM
jgi:hypothetical protein